MAPPDSFRQGRLFLLLLFLVMALGIAWAGYAQFLRQREAVRAEVHRELSAIADMKVRQVTAWRQERIADARIIAASARLLPAVRQVLARTGDPTANRQVREWMEVLRTSSGYANAILAGQEGIARLAVGRDTGSASHYADLVTQVLRSGDVVFSDFHRDNGLSGVHLGLSIPLPSEREGSPAGVMLLGIDPGEFLYPLIQTWPTSSPSGETLLVRREGNEVVYLNELRHRKNTALQLRLPLSEGLPAAQAVRGPQGAADGLDYRGVPVFAVVRRVPDTPWSLVAKMDAEEINRPLRYQSILLALIVASLIAATGAGAGLLWRRQRVRFYKQKYEAEIERRALLGHYDYLSRYANDIILLLDDDGRIMEANDRAAAVYGRDREELLQLNMRDLREPSARHDFDAQWSVTQERGGHVYETCHRRKDGTSFPVEVSVRTIEVDGVRFLQSIIRDITDRKAMTEELRQASQKLEAVIEAAPVGIVVVDGDGIVRLWNKAAERICGWTARGVLGRPVAETMCPGQESGADERLWKDLAAGRTVSGLEATRRRRDGSIVEVTVTSAPLLDAQGSTAGSMAVIADITERKQAVEALRDSERRVQLAVQASRTGLWDLDLRTNKVYLSPEWKAQLGYAGDELGDTPAEWESRLHPEDRERALAAVKECVAEPSGHLELVFRLRHKDGSYRWILSRGAVQTDARGEPRRLLGSHVDFTERKEMEEELERSTRLVQRILHATPNLLYIYDLCERRNTFVNRQVTEVLGYTAEQVQALGANLMAGIIHPDDAAAVAGHHRRCAAAADGETLDIEYRMRHANGLWRWLHSRDVAFARTPDGSVKQILGVAQDVTERRRAEDALRTSEARLAQAQRVAALGNWEIPHALGLDGDHPKEMYWSDEVYRIFGVFKESFIPTPDAVFGRFHPEDRDRVVAAIRACLVTGKAHNLDHRIVRGDGKQRHVRQHFALEGGEAGDLRMIGTVQDITEYKHLQDQFLQAQRLESVGRLAGGVAHDFNNLLTVIIGYSDLMLMKLGREDPLGASVGEIRNAAERATGLTEQLLAFSRKQLIQPKVLNLNSAIRDIEKMLARLIGEDVELVTHLDGSLDPVTADPNQVNQVLMNLAVNARDAMPNGGKLIIETRNINLDQGYVARHPDLRPGPSVSLVVSDTGMGMDEETRARLFEPFFTTKGPGKGTGLGLSTVYGIVKQAGGHIWVYSEPGVGTTFRICLPRAEGGVASDAPGAEPADPRGTETLLVVEDQHDVRQLAKEVLLGFGYQVLEAADGPAALEACRNHPGPIHLMLTDVVMPGMTGRELAGKLKESRPEMKVLFMSGYTDNMIVHHGVLDHDVAYLQKPFSPLSLAVKIRETLGT